MLLPSNNVIVLGARLLWLDVLICACLSMVVHA
jgi:hypothetical protein